MHLTNKSRRGTLRHKKWGRFTQYTLTTKGYFRLYYNTEGAVAIVMAKNPRGTQWYELCQLPDVIDFELWTAVK